MRTVKTSLKELDNNGGTGGLEIIIPETQGSPTDVVPNPIFLEYYEGKLMLRVWNGMEDPTEVIEIKLKEKSK